MTTQTKAENLKPKLDAGAREVLGNIAGEIARDERRIGDTLMQKIVAGLVAAYLAGRNSAMTRAKKRQLIRAALEGELPGKTYLEREKLIQEWMRFPYSAFEDSLDAGFLYPDATNPNIR